MILNHLDFEVTKKLVILFYLIISVRSYRLRVIEENLSNLKKLCHNTTFCHGKPHTMCLKEVNEDSNENFCNRNDEFQMLKIRKSHVVFAHNGVRDRFAREWNISNMNLLHYDDNLGEMARKFIRKCNFFNDDKCNYLFKKDYAIGQNRQYLTYLPRGNFIKRAIRNWFLEKNGTTHKIHILKWDYKSVMNLTQIIWPITQFVGCSGAIHNNGHVVVCFYWPPVNLSTHPFEFGAKCEDCPEDRQSCSLIFKFSCGLDEFNNNVQRIPIKEQNILGIILIGIIIDRILKFV